MLLSKLFEGQPDIEIKNIMYDSRDRLDKALFCCLNGLTSDAHKFVDQAIENGAIVIVHSKPLSHYREDIIYICINDIEAIFPELVNKFYDYPSSKLFLIGVTGTNGKTTVSYVAKQLLSYFKPTGYIGTIGVEYGEHHEASAYTTYNLVGSSEFLGRMINHDIESVVMEVSSQGLEQNRVSGMQFDVAVFTNLTHDHLDVHMTMENYYQAKKKLFLSLEYGKPAIINIDDEYGERLSKELVFDALTVSMHKPATYRIANVLLKPMGSTFDLVVDDHVYPISTTLLGDFNVMNLVQAIAIVHQAGIAIDDIVNVVSDIRTINGRMESVDCGQPFSVIVDFAHTPDGFKKIMSYAQSVIEPGKRVIALFGSPGKRDKDKRIKFGKLAEKYCDLAILTEDDNRDELVESICQEIAQGMLSTPFLIIESRVEAIRQALSIARTGDIVLLLGKGIENFIAREFENEPYLGDRLVAIDILNDFMKEKIENEIKQID